MNKIVVSIVAALALIAIVFTAVKNQDSRPPEAEPAPLMVAEPSSFGLSKPVKRIVYLDGACAGVVREDGSYDGDCTEASKDLPSIAYDEFFDPGRMPLD
jgi:hypothetical protein